MTLESMLSVQKEICWGGILKKQIGYGGSELLSVPVERALYIGIIEKEGSVAR